MFKPVQQTTNWYFFFFFFLFFFSQKTSFDISYELSAKGEHLHKISKPIFWENTEKYFKMLTDLILNQHIN